MLDTFTFLYVHFHNAGQTIRGQTQLKLEVKKLTKLWFPSKVTTLPQPTMTLKDNVFNVKHTGSPLLYTPDENTKHVSVQSL